MSVRRLASVVALATLPTFITLISAIAAGPLLPAQPLIQPLRQHDKPEPFAVQPFFDLGWAPAEMPYRVDKLHPGPGVLAPIMQAKTPLKAGVGYTGAGDGKEAFGQVTYRGNQGSVTAAEVAESSGGFEDGNGERVRFGYDRHTEQLALTYRSFRASVVHDRIDDNVLPLARTTVENGVSLSEGFGSDPVRTERTLATVSAEQDDFGAGIDKLKFELRYTGLERIANNFDLRPSTSTSRNEAKPSRQVLGFAVAGDSDWSDDIASRLTLSGQTVWHDATRRGGPNTLLTTLSGYQYPGVEMWESAANLDTVWRLDADARVSFGVRYDYASADATKLDQTMQVGSGATAFSGTPRSLYETYCGKGCADASDDHMISAKLEGTQEFLSDRAALTGSVGRIMRAADTQERYFALPSASGTTATGTSSRQVGNPSLAPEQHYRAEIAASLKGEDWIEFGRTKASAGESLQSWRIALSGYADHVVDFISRDRAHGQSGVTAADNAFIWRNVDAELVGAGLEAAWNLTAHWSTKALLTWRWGENISGSRPLYGIDPLEANWLLEYQDTIEAVGAWNAGTKVRAVAGQGRVDADPSTGSGFDPLGTGGFGLLDLYAGLRIRDALGIRIGIDNLFDKAYAEFNPTTVTDDANPTAVNGPGRAVYVRIVGTF